MLEVELLSPAVLFVSDSFLVSSFVDRLGWYGGDSLERQEWEKSANFRVPSESR